MNTFFNIYTADALLLEHTVELEDAMEIHHV